MSSRNSGRSRNESNENNSSSSTVHEKEATSIEIDGRSDIWSVAFSAEGKRIVSGGDEEKIRRWRVEDGKEVGAPMDARGAVFSIAVSQDGKWLVSGTGDGRVTVWNAESHNEVSEFKGHRDCVGAVDVSPDGTRIATGSDDKTACIWSLSTRQRQLGPLKHNCGVVAVRFSPDERLIATATWDYRSIWIYDRQDGRLLFTFPVRVNSQFNQSLAWASDSKLLFALSRSGNINCLRAIPKGTRSKWPIHSSHDPRCIALASNGTFIAASAGSSVSFWDTTTHEQIGSVIHHTADIVSMSISSNYELVTGGGKTVTLRRLSDILPSRYSNTCEQEISLTKDEMAGFEGTIESLRAQEETSNNKNARLEETDLQLRNQLSDSQPAANQKEDNLNETIKSLHTQDKNSNGKIAHFEETVEEIRANLIDSQYTAGNDKDNFGSTIRSLRAELHAQEASFSRKIAQLEKTVQQLRIQHADSQRKADSLVQILRAHEQKHYCEVLYVEGRIIDAAVSLFEIANTVSEEVRADKLIMDWLAEFTNRCISTLGKIGDEASSAEKHEEALATYSTALLLSPSPPNTLLTKWASMVLIHGSANEALGSAAKFKLPKFVTYRAVCGVLEEDERIMEATECFLQMQRELGEDTSIDVERAQWEFSFQQQCTEKLEKLGDAAMNSRGYNEAAEYFSTILSLNPVDCMHILIKRSKARASMNSWEEALNDADEAIKLDPSSHLGYERRHAALHGGKRHAEAVEAFHTMLSRLDESPDERVRELRGCYVDAIPVIRDIVEQTIRDMPRVLIDTTTGRLYDKKQQAEAFEALPIYNQLVSTMTTKIDHARIWRVVKKFYQYVMLSHKWQPNEPTFQLVENTSIYELPVSVTHSKLQRFCKLVRSLRFEWAWSDTCCVNQVDKGVLQESLVAMFRWYRGSSLTVVHLLGVLSDAQKFGCLWKSIWNTRGWTYQEYLASAVVQFYTEDWKPYLGLDTFNHKESPIILSEMERAMNIATEELATLRPGLDRVREKLYLASMRHTTREEDIAYSLFGIFNVAIPVIYGEGNQAVGRLLEHVLTGSGDVTILAWTGTSSHYNSCLPMDLTTYNQTVPPHVPQLIETAEMHRMVTELRSSSPDLSLVVRLYDRLNELPAPSLGVRRLRLPGIIFRLTGLVRTSEPDTVINVRVYHATTSTFGDIEVKTTDDLTGMKHLCLVHPWIRPLLDQEFLDGAAALDRTTQALRFVTRLRQPFGALLFEPLSRVEYRRVATDSLISVQIREEVSLTDLIDNIRTIEVV